MIELTAIDFGKARCLLNLRSFAAAFLALSMSLGLPLGAAAQVVYEFMVAPDGLTLVRCTSPSPLTAFSNDCSDNTVRIICNSGEVIAVVRRELGGGCDTGIATGLQVLTLNEVQVLTVDTLITGLEAQVAPEEVAPVELPAGGGPEDEEGQVDSTSGSSTESFQTQVIDSTNGVTTAPPF